MIVMGSKIVITKYSLSSVKSSQLSSFNFCSAIKVAHKLSMSGCEAIASSP